MLGQSRRIHPILSDDNLIALIECLNNRLCNTYMGTPSYHNNGIRPKLIKGLLEVCLKKGVEISFF